jgi:hypothetical protein
MSGEPLNCSGCCRRRAGARSWEGDHERTIGLGAEGNPIAAATADAMDLATAFARGLVGRATKRTPSWRNTPGVSGGTTKTDGMPCR